MPTTDEFGEIKWEQFVLPNIPIYQTKLPEDVIDRLWRYVDKAKINFNSDLAGNIGESLLLEDEDDYFMKHIVGPIAQMYVNNTHSIAWVRNDSVEKPQKLSLSKLWVNFQNQLEFNPIHNHAGFVSFVIWMKIPTEWKDQLALPICANSNAPSAGEFQFTYSNVLGGHEDYLIHMGKAQEGWILVFPAQLRHQVYPYYNCDEQRISISGNIAWDNRND